MWHSILLTGTLWVGSLVGTVQGSVHLNPDMQQEMLEIGAQGMEHALRACEDYFGKAITLPPALPGVAFTHVFGRCYDPTDPRLDAHLEIEYMHKSQPENHYSLELYPAEYHQQLSYLKFEDVMLGHNTTAKYYNGPLNTMKLLTFKTKEWQYVLHAVNLPESRINQAELVSVAQSLLELIDRKRPQSAKWGETAMKSAGKHYNMEVVDYLYSGRFRVSPQVEEERFKLWLRQGSLELSVHVTVVYDPNSERLLRIRYEEV
ncbi:hypothetical protein JCM10914A_44650 [Paenibacillus sp. JCM 10914]|uniref:DUF3889 domain-containing protein n=1 Tax=Paenibacillus sp. JCM 10914 TaxID=1236974 RepID=UPI0003CC40E5|nr:DUF3889 domain-containing protein [Paenibacillus sp. JCM 10914]GAE07503.1 hypothetical protein JCM10914_3735 [Paenibacillus sp. JCM 10914]